MNTASVVREPLSLTSDPMPELADLEHLVDDLVQLLAQLEEENRALRSKLQTLAAERAGLAQHNEAARKRLEDTLERLDALERGL